MAGRCVDHRQRPVEQAALGHDLAGACAGGAIECIGYRGNDVVQAVGHIQRVVRAKCQARRPEQEVVAVGALRKAIADDRLADQHGRLALWNLQLQTQHGGLLDAHRELGRRIDHVWTLQAKTRHADEQRRAVAVIDHRHVAPRIVDGRPGPRCDHLAVGIQHQHAAIALGSRGAVGARRAADDHPAGLQHGHGCGQAHATRALRQLLRQLGKQRRLLGGRPVIHDGGAGALQVGKVVEVVDQDIVLDDLAGRNRCNDDRVGIEITVVGHGGGQRHVAMHGFEKAGRCLVGKGGARAENGDCSNERSN